MWAFIAMTFALFVGLAYVRAWANTEEIIANWPKYHNDPFFIFIAFMFKPEDDPRSRLQFMTDNFQDVVGELINSIMSVLLQPLFQSFKLMTDALVQNLQGIFNVKALLDNMWKQWNKMVDIFQRRFNGVFHRLRVTFVMLMNAMEKAYGVAASSLFAGLSTIHSMMSAFDFIIKVIITILIILVVMVILLFFVLAPFVPLIFTTIGIISATAMGAAVGGMAESFCFTRDTLIVTLNGPIRIDEIEIGQRLSTTNKVLGILSFIPDTYDLYNLDGITVSGTHIVYHEGKPIHVKNHPDAEKLPKTVEKLYCLVTSEHTIPIIGKFNIHVFSDWEELETKDELLAWYQDIYATLNGVKATKAPKAPKAPKDVVLNSEAAVAANTFIGTLSGITRIETLRPGDTVISAEGTPTKVLGVVELDKSCVCAVHVYGEARISAGSWVHRDGIWDHPTTFEKVEDTRWYSLFTESGTFRVETKEGHVNLRDFSDLGEDKIDQTYGKVLEFMRGRAFFQNHE